VTYLYNTLHYYETHLRERTNLKRKLVHAIIGSLKDNRPLGWCLSDTYLKCAMNPREENPWVPDDTYYCKLIGRLVDNILLKVCIKLCQCLRASFHQNTKFNFHLFRYEIKLRVFI